MSKDLVLEELGYRFRQFPNFKRANRSQTSNGTRVFQPGVYCGYLIYAEALNTEAFDLFKIPLTMSERAGKIIGNVANCNSHNGKPGNPIISNNE